MKLRTLLKYLVIVFALLTGLTLTGCATKIDKPQYEIIDLEPINVSANTEFKPQSKVWKYDNAWWAVLPDSQGTYLWQLQDRAWVKTLRLSEWTDTHADVKPNKDLAHILLFRGEESGLVSIQYDKQAQTYQPWQQRPDVSPITFHPETETATVDMDSKGRLWSAYDTVNDVMVIYSDPPYTQWSDPILVGTGIYKDDICLLTTLKNEQIAVLWSNQNSRYYGFRVHRDGDAPETWSADEKPASQSAHNDIGDGMSDDHINVCLAKDGTLGVAVKTSYDTDGYPLIGFMRRHPDGRWDDLMYINDDGTRGIICLNEKYDQLLLFYTFKKKIQVCESNAVDIAFDSTHVVMDYRLNHTTGPKHNATDDLVVMASDAKTAHSILIRWK